MIDRKNTLFFLLLLSTNRTFSMLKSNSSGILLTSAGISITNPTEPPVPVVVYSPFWRTFFRPLWFVSLGVSVFQFWLLVWEYPKTSLLYSVSLRLDFFGRFDMSVILFQVLTEKSKPTPWNSSGGTRDGGHQCEDTLRREGTHIHPWRWTRITYLTFFPLCSVY